MMDTQESQVAELAVLRGLVGFLGEKRQLNWWDTDFLSPTGLQYLQINFPRSAFSAGCNAVTEAAKRLHDERIGRGGVYHLFRLPTSVEEAIHCQLLRAEFKEFLVLHIKDANAALDRLRKSFHTPVDAPQGPVQVGTVNNLLSDFSVEELAKHYHDAFSQGKLCFPYFVGR